jgi:hypothetical protein
MGHSLQTVAVLAHVTDGLMIGLAACVSRSGEPVMDHASKYREGMTILLFSLPVLGKKTCQKLGQGMSNNHTQNDEGYVGENQIKRRGPKPGVDEFPLLSKKIKSPVGKHPIVPTRFPA